MFARLRRTASCLLFALLLACVAGPPDVRAQDAVPPSLQVRTAPTATVPLERLSSIDEDRLRREDAARSGAIRPYRYGTVRQVAFSPASHGAWERLSSGDWLWRLRVASPEARSLSLGFDDLALPPGAALYLHGPERAWVRGPYTAADVSDGRLNTPIVRGSEAIVEVRVPAEARTRLALTLRRVVHGYRSLLPSEAQTGPSAKAGACNVDVACSEADPWEQQVRSVALYSFEVGTNAFVCTGSLVNNTAEDRRPFFLTAEHCVSDPSTASTLVLYWNYQSPTCRTLGTSANASAPNDDRLDQTTSGAVLRARYGNVHSTGTISGKPDLALLELEQSDRLGAYGVFFSGWNLEATDHASAVSIHHPAGGAKRIAVDRDPLAITPYASTTTSSGSTHWLIEAWEAGTTEGGSSGSPLYDPQGRVVGVLSGGSAGCTSSLSSEDNNLPDWYGRLGAGFETTDYESTSFREWLDPAGTGATQILGLGQEADERAPGPVTGFQLVTVRRAEVELRWIASGDDGPRGVASRYDLRARTDGPITPANFDTAQRLEGPAPETAGTTQSVTVPVSPDSTYFFAVRAVDEAGNTSPITVLSTESGTPKDISPVTDPTLRTPFPNPMRTQATVAVTVPEAQRVQVTLYDLQGRRVARVFDGDLQPYTRRNIPMTVSALAPGVYFVRATGESFARTVRAVVVR